jgi:hypothetical protein
MFLIDDLLTAPGKAALFVFQELARKAQEELLNDESVKRELQEVYNLLSSGKISEAEFEGRENRLLERLEQIAKLKFQIESGTDAMANTVTYHESSADAARPQAAPVIESQCDIASFSATGSQDFALRADVFEALRSLSHLISPVSSDATTDERIIDSRPINSKDQRDTAHESANSVPELRSPALTISDKEPQRSEPSLSKLAAVVDHVQPSREPMPATVVESVSSSPRLIQPQPAPVERTPAPSVAPSAPKPIQMSDAVDIALRTLTITRHKVSSIISAAKADDGWRVAVELVERAAVPDTGDLLGIYEVQLNHAGEVMRYERTRVRRRNDLR